jgi:hypothetical protein
MVTPGMGWTAREDEASAPCDGCLGTTQSSSRTTSNPAVGSGASAGQFSHWPHPGGGASSLGISTTVAWATAVGTGSGGTAVAAVAATVATAAAVASCCDPVVAAMLRGGNLSRLRSLLSVVLSTSAASWAQTRPT